MAKHFDLVRTGESLAMTLMEGMGYEIPDENWTLGKTEIDLVAYKYKVFFYRSENTHGQCIRSTGGFCGKHANDGYWPMRQMIIFTRWISRAVVRFDIVSILFDRTRIIH